MMTAFTLEKLAPVLKAQWFGGDARIHRVCTDSRRLQNGDLYVALRGEQFDGNDFVALAKDSGAAAAVVSKPVDVALPRLQVEDSRLALGQIAAENRRLFKGPVIAVSGSAGKTSCKEMMAAILGQCGNVHATRGNYNNEVGVPLTLLELSPEHDYAVIEMGAAKRGDIAYLCQFAKPQIAVLTNALSAHLEGFGDLQTIAETKGEIYRSLPPNGIGVVNIDDAYADLWQSYVGQRQCYRFSLDSLVADFYAKHIVDDIASQSFVLVSPAGEISVNLPLPGRHNVRNALAAAAATFAAGASLPQIAAGLASLQPVAGRLNAYRCDNGTTIIDDTYNANPEAVKAAIDVLSRYAGRRCLVLGDMAELGERAAAMHADVARYARQRGIDTLLTAGQWADTLAGSFGEQAFTFADKDSLLDALKQQWSHFDAILIKGSRSAGMDVIARALLQTIVHGEAH